MMVIQTQTRTDKGTNADTEQETVKQRNGQPEAGRKVQTPALFIVRNHHY